MGEILFAGLIWVVSHLGISSTPLRKVIVSLVGEGIYLGLYSLVSLASLGYLIWIYGQVPRFDYLWLPDPQLYWLAKITMPVALIFLVGGFMVSNPTMVGGQLTSDQLAEPANLARGVTRITRHPFQWSVVIWAVGHIVANGDWVSVIFFTALGLVSLIGTVLMDAKKTKTLSEGWPVYAGVTSNLPFAAIIAGRNRLVLNELWAPIGVGVAAFLLLYYFHEALTGSIIG